MDADKLRDILAKHAKWLRGEEGGERANLSGANLRLADLRRANLRGADLSGADLSWANLSDADLRWADLIGANLIGANLSGANLRLADLRRANLRGADLSGADLSWANLSGADLSWANLSGADLSGADLPERVVVPDIDRAILNAIDAGGTLDMCQWHTCETTHCRAGWAIALASDAGRVLEDIYGPNVAAALIYAASGSHPVPDFYATDEDAMADLRARAAKGGT